MEIYRTAAAMYMSWKRIGVGMCALSEAEATGKLHVIRDIEDVLRLMNNGAEDVIVLLDAAGATTITPIFSSIKGIICTTGGITSHLAIVAREFNVPCIMGADVKFDDNLQGRTVKLDKSGEIFASDDENDR